MTIQISFIIPTRDRAALLCGALAGLVAQDLPPERYEVLVVDNGSTDATASDVAALAAAHPERNIRLLDEPVPGLLAARHCGSVAARGEILTFLDDDVELAPDFGRHVLDAFADADTALVGGPSVPRYLAAPPPWLDHYCLNDGPGLVCGYLSLADRGDVARDMNPVDVWGLNFSIRRAALFELGGFHPDNVPEALQMFQGDGESGLAMRATARNFRARYAPGARVTHVLPPSRLSEEGFQKRAFYQGVCDSYTEIRAKGGLTDLETPLPAREASGPYGQVHAGIRNAYVDGYLFHQKAVAASPALLAWVLRPDYWDYAYPALEEGLVLTREWAALLSRRPLAALGDPARVCRLALAYAGEGRFDEGLRAVFQVERAHPRLPGPRGIRCAILAAAGRPTDAARAAREELAVDPGSALARAFLERQGGGAEPAPVAVAAMADLNQPMTLHNIDADQNFYYGEIPRQPMLDILREGRRTGDPEGAVRRFCQRTGNAYFQEYALDPRRALGLRLLGDLAGKRLLDYGCGIGSLGVVAARAGAAVTFVDSCLPRLELALQLARQSGATDARFYACRTWKSLPEAAGKFDAVIVNGVLEWIPSTVGTDFGSVVAVQLDFLSRLRDLLADGGCLYLAIENRFALQYLMGYPEDHTEIPYLSLLPREAANALHRQRKGTDFTTWTWSLGEFRRRLPRVGLGIRQGYAIFPDYRFPRRLVSLDDPEGLRAGLDLETYEASEMRTRLSDYFLETGRIADVVYSYALLVEKTS
ncbi:MAG: glycosyltransferase [Desulfovibrio sp.]